MPYLELALPSGVYGNGTDYQGRGRWVDAQLVRFTGKTVRPVGGWIAHSASAVTGKGRAILTWKDNTNNALIGIGTESRLYTMSRSGVLNDITPVGLTAGRANATAGGGYGVGLYGADAYGAPRSDTTLLQDATVWSLDTWGEHLVGMNAEDAKPYEWALNPAVRAVAIANAPTGRALVVTSERSLMVLGAEGNPRRAKWSDAEDNTRWTPGAATQAGAFDLQTPGRLMCGKRLSGEMGLWTDVDFWVATPTLDRTIYAFNRKGSGCGAISQQAVAVVDSQSVWMSQNGFWTYNGFVQPLECEVFDHVFANLNRTQASKVTSFHNSSFGEVWWFYPSSASLENDCYVAWNYREGHWTIGRLSRLAAADRGAFTYPLLIGGDGLVYEHETGWDWAGAPQPHIVSGPIQLGAGDNVAHALKLVGDEAVRGQVQVSFLGRFYPNGDEVEHGPYSLAQAPTDVRFSARQLQMKVEGLAASDWRFGVARLDLRSGGGR